MTDKRIRQGAQIISILSAVGAGLVAPSVIAVASAAPGVPGNNDVLNNRGLDADVGSDGSSVADRARGTGYNGTVAETVAINQSLTINDLDVMGNWYYRPDYMALMSNCANT